MRCWSTALVNSGLRFLVVPMMDWLDSREQHLQLQ
jgi:hypothetical protein